MLIDGALKYFRYTYSTSLLAFFLYKNQIYVTLVHKISYHCNVKFNMSGRVIRYYNNLTEYARYPDRYEDYQF